MLVEVFLFLVVVFLWVVVVKEGRPKGFPPGPKGLPLVGYMPFLTAHPARKCFQLSKKYGDVLGVTIGSYHVLVLNSESTIRDALKEMSFAGRPYFPMLKERSGGKKKGVLIGAGPEWHEQRRFVLRNLRDFGFGKKSMEDTILDEANELVSRFRSHFLNKPVDLSMSFNVAVVNSLWTMVAGERMAQDDPRILGLVDGLVASFRSNFLTGPGIFMPWLDDYFPFILNWLGGRTEAAQNLRRLLPFLKEVLDQHRATYDPNYARDLVDIYYQEMDSCTDPNSSFYGSENVVTLRTVLLDLFIAGTETTSTTLRWAILYLLRNPSVQESVQSEIDRVVGQSRPPSLQDRPNLPYTEATLMEVQRIATILPFAVFHATTEDVTFRGYHIPKDTMVLPNLYAVLNNPEHWPEPERFRPERHLSEDGTVKRDPHLIPFSTGKRVCLGETLARDSLFLFFTSLLQNFTFITVPGKDAPHPEDLFNGLVTMPNPYDVVIRERH